MPSQYSTKAFRVYEIISRLYTTIFWLVVGISGLASLALGISVHDLVVILEMRALGAPLVSLIDIESGTSVRRSFRMIALDLESGRYIVEGYSELPVSNRVEVTNRIFENFGISNRNINSRAYSFGQKTSKSVPEIPSLPDIPLTIKLVSPKDLIEYKKQGLELDLIELRKRMRLRDIGYTEYDELLRSLLLDHPTSRSLSDLDDPAMRAWRWVRISTVVLSLALVIVALKRWVVWVWFGGRTNR